VVDKVENSGNETKGMRDNMRRSGGCGKYKSKGSSWIGLQLEAKKLA